MSFIGTSAFGLRMPIIKEGDDVVDIIMSFNNFFTNNFLQYTKQAVYLYQLIEKVILDFQKKNEYII